MKTQVIATGETETGQKGAWHMTSIGVAHFIPMGNFDNPKEYLSPQDEGFIINIIECERKIDTHIPWHHPSKYIGIGLPDISE